MVQTTDKIYQLSIPTPFAVGDVHTYLLKGETLSLIDAGVKTEEAWKALESQLHAIGYSPNDIKQVILTHHHPDHIGLVDRFEQLEGVYGHEDNKRWLERDETFLNRFQTFFYTLYKQFGVDHTHEAFFKHLRDPLKYVAEGTLTGSLKEGDQIPGHPDWSVMETPGHAESHLSFYRSLDQSMLSGDHLLYHISSNPLLEPPRLPGGPRPRPLVTYQKTLDKCLHMDIREVYPGHGPVFTNPNELIKERMKKQEYRSNKVYHMLEEGPLTPFQVCKQLFPKHIEKQFGLTMSETVGQLDVLEEEGRVHVHLEDGVYYYEAK
ncbi:MULTISPECIES: MBL fold metallo-hydrolase [Pontibacillus]|uniref:MBL fold metallo-hydrolase n=1 Tax=Pontibacillus chungwhensis TaxID=265426 RepID=A0ABY8UTV7_9BACI|nr:MULTISPECIES: MBL fold metallo-hydrolase [Pontibacillus]MCD5323086.1 MBL fold metallo-hydrolase [Pontibacillus sp. HN14]WIF96477.1 MBL fold metallo-hydrolase [Pontibacillus chungwhensis]